VSWKARWKQVGKSWKRVGTELESELEASWKELEARWKERWRYLDASESTDRRDVEV
jgi:hypothetical protein